jgi:tRNA(Met) C34 N-acetyltransferase TmcA
MIGNLNIANSNRKDTNIKFTKDQEIAVHELIEFLAQPWDDKKYINALCGAGGTGKTFVIKYVINNCKWSGGVIGCAAPTHKACRVLSNSIGGKDVNTIQSLFGFRLDVNIENFDPENPAFNPVGKDKLDGLKVLIIDEASMLNAKLVKYISNKCKKLQIKVIMLGEAIAELKFF